MKELELDIPIYFLVIENKDGSIKAIHNTMYSNLNEVISVKEKYIEYKIYEIAIDTIEIRPLTIHYDK